MMPRSLSQTGPEKRRFTWPKGTPQIIALLLVLLVDSLVAPHFYQVVLQDGRLVWQPDRYSQPRRAGGAAGDWHDAGDRHRRHRDLSVGAVMAMPARRPPR